MFHVERRLHRVADGAVFHVKPNRRELSDCFT